MQVWEIRPDHSGWRLSFEGDTEGPVFETLAMAERRARWLAIRHEVKGWPAEVRIFDGKGAMIGALRGERYAPSARAAFSQAA